MSAELNECKFGPWFGSHFFNNLIVYNGRSLVFQSIKQKVKYRETTVIIFSTQFFFKSQNNTMKAAGASSLMSSGCCFSIL